MDDYFLIETVTLLKPFLPESGMSMYTKLFLDLPPELLPGVFERNPP